MTTDQDGGGRDPATLRILRDLHHEGKLPIEVVSFIYAPLLDRFGKDSLPEKSYRNGVRVGGVKLVLDGGSPGRTAYLREPYYVQLQGEDHYRGYPHYREQEQLNGEIAHYYGLGIPLNIHALGDAAVDQALIAISTAEKQYPGKIRRTNLIHLQVVGEDQIDIMRNLDVTLTFQANHNYDFGDLHRTYILGPERAAHLNPARSAMDHGINTTIHHDAPVHPVDQFAVISAAVNRITRSGFLLGKDQRISVAEALKASTINAAYQYFEEESKGSIEPGKQADFIILSDNPLTMDPRHLAQIRILKTIKAGRTVYNTVNQ